jgi:hypothetical protein
MEIFALSSSYSFTVLCVPFCPGLIGKGLFKEVKCLVQQHAHKESILPAGHGSCCHRHLVKKVCAFSSNMTSETGFYVAGAVAVATALGHPEGVRTGFLLPSVPLLPPPHRQGCFFKRSKPAFTCRARPLLPQPHRQGCFFKRSKPVFTCRARLLLLPLPHPSRFFLRGQKPVSTCRARPLLPLPLHQRSS